MTKTDSLLIRFISKIQVSEGHWIWIGAKKEGEYGLLKRPNLNKNYKAHRFSYEFFNGIIPNGMCVLHSCDIPSCVNPKHLFLGTLKDNSKDMIKKGRGKGQYVQGHKESKITKIKRSKALKGNINAKRK